MYLHGSFVNKRGQTVKVEILTAGSNAVSKEICRDSDVVFPDDPVEIRCESDASESHLVRSSASIRLLTRGFMPDLYCASVLDGVVNIHVGGICVFAGYIVPQSYSQPFSNTYDEYEINCIDALSALQHLKYKGIGTVGVSYDYVRATAQQRTFADIVEEMLNGVGRKLEIMSSVVMDPGILYDNSRSVDGSSAPIFTDISISELLFLGDTETDVWTQQDVLEEIMRYLNLRIVQDGFNFRIYSDGAVGATRQAVSWSTLRGAYAGHTDINEITITSEIAMDTDASITIGEVYNRIELTCEVKEMENLIESPLDSDNMRSPYSNKQLYVTEYSLQGGKWDDLDAIAVVPAFKELCETGLTAHTGSIVDWFVQVQSSMNWSFMLRGPGGTDYMETAKGYMELNKNQEFVPDHLILGPGAHLLSFGKVERNVNTQDNSPTARVSMTDYLAISVNGNGKDTKAEAYPSEESLAANVPLAEYTGQVTGGVFSPADDETTNYIVFSGSMILNPLFRQSVSPLQAPWFTNNWNVIAKNPDKTNLSETHKVPAKGYEGGRVYMTKWYAADYPGAQETVVYGPGLMPYTGELEEEYEYNYSAIGDGSDTISKVGVLACMLIIGDKCVVETGTDGKPGDFQWKQYKTREECSSDDEYYQQSFTLGFDPKIGDKLVGTEFDLQNNIDYRMGLDAEGTAIPIRKSDKVSGQVTFRILGPCYTVWDNVTRRHKTWFRSAKWSSNSVPLLSHVSTIFIKDFEAKVYSDNGLINNTDNSDLMYVSYTDETFVSVKDDIKFRITTALTKAERAALEVSDSLKISAPVVVSTGDALLEVKDNFSGEVGKPEQLYVDAVYHESHLPRVNMTHKLRATSRAASMFNRFTHPALPGKVFRVCGISRGLGSGWDEVTLKEIPQDDDQD